MKSTERAITDLTCHSYKQKAKLKNISDLLSTPKSYLPEIFTVFEDIRCPRSCKATTSSGKWGWYQKPISNRVIERIICVNKCNILKMVSAHSECSRHISYYNYFCCLKKHTKD